MHHHRSQDSIVGWPPISAIFNSANEELCFFISLWGFDR
ncbi:hypothetical protein COLO4_35870 [Corchorus olitorius]|uniref:Uncharacterized protein n=1 Tax=Corchorus olitorius TaxID=93759 RepID=A0A1R3GCJ5_9ROSI|nr:hypothetical protein COLO4_35870 [Corchorus olitorius]